MSPILNCPTEIFYHISSYLDQAENVKLALTNKEIFNQLESIVRNNAEMADKAYVDKRVEERYPFIALRRCAKDFAFTRPYRAYLAIEREFKILREELLNKRGFKAELVRVVYGEGEKEAGAWEVAGHQVGLPFPRPYSLKLSILVADQILEYKKLKAIEENDIKKFHTPFSKLVTILCAAAHRDQENITNIYEQAIRIANMHSSITVKAQLMQEVTKSLSEVIDQHPLSLGEIQNLISIAPDVTKELIESLCHAAKRLQDPVHSYNVIGLASTKLDESQNLIQIQMRPEIIRTLCEIADRLKPPDFDPDTSLLILNWIRGGGGDPSVIGDISEHIAIAEAAFHYYDEAFQRLQTTNPILSIHAACSIAKRHPQQADRFFSLAFDISLRERSLTTFSSLANFRTIVKSICSAATVDAYRSNPSEVMRWLELVDTKIGEVDFTKNSRSNERLEVMCALAKAKTKIIPEQGTLFFGSLYDAAYNPNDYEMIASAIFEVIKEDTTDLPHVLNLVSHLFDKDELQIPKAQLGVVQAVHKALGKRSNHDASSCELLERVLRMILERIPSEVGQTEKISMICSLIKTMLDISQELATALFEQGIDLSITSSQERESVFILFINEIVNITTTHTNYTERLFQTIGTKIENQEDAESLYTLLLKEGICKLAEAKKEQLDSLEEVLIFAIEKAERISNPLWKSERLLDLARIQARLDIHVATRLFGTICETFKGDGKHYLEIIHTMSAATIVLNVTLEQALPIISIIIPFTKQWTQSFLDNHILMESEHCIYITICLLKVRHGEGQYLADLSSLLAQLRKVMKERRVLGYARSPELETTKLRSHLEWYIPSLKH